MIFVTARSRRTVPRPSATTSKKPSVPSPNYRTDSGPSGLGTPRRTPSPGPCRNFSGPSDRR
ncbi:hypothetical protein [Saccharothrix coeruleofusca]|uniref:hypothetical protein n=1 Tax=Saccharothrix coeruleofusca TaxID=33919 RepID=UPI0016705900|nr:hypothetical protein [Saccharothrix coeruleofusca]